MSTSQTASSWIMSKHKYHIGSGNITKISLKITQISIKYNEVNENITKDHEISQKYHTGSENITKKIT